MLAGGGDGSGDDALISGPLSLEDGCLRVGARLAVWPHDTAWDPARQQVVLPGGRRVDLGDAVRSGGGYRDVASVVGQLDRAGVRLLRRCARAQEEIAVMDAGGSVTAVTP